jgi:hypothetical protein
VPNSKEIASTLNEAIRYGKAKGVSAIFCGAVPEAISGEVDEYGYLGTREDIRTCPYVDCSAALQLDGKFMYCVWQTFPMFDWKKENCVDAMQNTRALKVREMIKAGVIPYECSGAPCPYVGRRLSTEPKPAKHLEFSGGWQVSMSDNS